MTQSLPSTINAKKKLWAAVGGPLGLWSTVTRSSGELSWVLGNKFTLMGANAAVMLFLAKQLDLKTYGLLVITISAQLLISRLLLVGVDSGMIRLTALPELQSREREVVTAGLVTLACTSAALLVISLLAMPVLSLVKVSPWIIACVAGGSIGLALVDYGYSFRLARHEYPRAAFIQGGTALWRLGLTATVAVMLPASPIAVFVAYHGSSLLSGLVQALTIGRVNWHVPHKDLLKRLLSYSLWLGKAHVIVIFCLYQGTFLLTFLKQPVATGLFGLALSLSLGFFAIYQAYSEYLSVRVRSVENIEHLPSFIRRALAGSIILIVASVPIVFVIKSLVPWLLGPEWHEVVAIFVYLSAAMMLLLFNAPLVATSHYLLRPHLITFGWVTCATFIAILGLILAPQMGAIGAAIAQLIGTMLALFVVSWMVSRALRSAMEEAGGGQA